MEEFYEDFDVCRWSLHPAFRAAHIRMSLLPMHRDSQSVFHSSDI